MKSYIILALNILFLQSCIPGAYKFNQTSIDPNVTTFYIDQFELRATNAPPNVAENFEQALNLKIRQESRLQENQVNPDIEFKGTITGFDVSSEAPQSGEQIAFQRLTMSVRVEFVDNIDEERNWEQSFNRFADFGSGENVLDVQDELIEVIHEQLMEDIFNRAFTNW